MDDETIGVTVPSDAQPGAPATPATSGGAFTTGDLVAGRYRIVGLLGRGGMGEVYRADDLTLGQPIALKFLPRAVERHPEQLERMRAEVRVTRQVSHPNVCRVYDLGSIDGPSTALGAGRHFLTMEYIDGEDLASLLRRIGRLPSDKALEIARQLCAALAAAHDRGVIHRDLKPANIMLDGRGKVRVTDFGLAVAADDSDRATERAGTPAYMAPEQLSGSALSTRTDIYALGLVLYELFTGRRLFKAGTVDELVRLQSNSERLRESASDINLDPAVERVIMRCVEFDPAARPASALAVAAALPGGDPLAAALAAGETPSPELVAAARDEGLLTIGQTMLVAAVIVVGCGIAAVLAARRSAFTIMNPPYSADVLAVKAGELLQRLRPGDAAARTAADFDVDGPFGLYMLEHQDLGWTWSDVDRVKPPPLYFWYRTSPHDLLPRLFPGGGRVSPVDPPRVLPGMALVETDVRGRLRYLDAKPSVDDDARPPNGGGPWDRLFQEAGLDATRFAPAAPEWVPLSWGDARAAWTGTALEFPKIPLRVEAAAYRGLPTFFVVAAPWTSKPGRAETNPPAARVAIGIVALIAVAIPLAAGILMARGSLRSGRADRRGAARLTTVVAVLQLSATWLVMTHVSGLGELTLLLQSLVIPLVVATATWVLYIGLEPFIRRTWPASLISWNRAIDGRIKDARIARDVLIGLAATGVLEVFDALLPFFTLVPPRGLNRFPWIAASSLRQSVGAAIVTVTEAMLISLVLLILLCLVRMAVRRDWIATVAFAAMVGVMIATSYAGAFHSPSGALFVVVYGATYGAAWAVLLVRFGLVAFIAHELSDMLLYSVVTINPSAWYSGPSMLALAAIGACTAYAAWVCISSRSAAAVPVPANARWA